MEGVITPTVVITSLHSHATKRHRGCSSVVTATPAVPTRAERWDVKKIIARVRWKCSEKLKGMAREALDMFGHDRKRARTVSVVAKKGDKAGSVGIDPAGLCTPFTGKAIISEGQSVCRVGTKSRAADVRMATAPSQTS